MPITPPAPRITRSYDGLSNLYKRSVEKRSRAIEDGMPPIPDAAIFQKRLATLPLATYQAGETVRAAGSRSGRLLILRKGVVAIVKEAIEIAKVNPDWSRVRGIVRFARSAT